MSEFDFNVVQQISVDLANEPGMFAELMEALLKAKVLVHGISVESGHSVSRVHFVVNHPDDALQVLREHGEGVATKEILAVTILERKTGQITRMARILADAGVNIDTIYLTSAAEGAKPTIYISATRIPAHEVMQCLQKGLSER